jgi:hypothetical protein
LEQFEIRAVNDHVALNLSAAEPAEGEKQVVSMLSPKLLNWFTELIRTSLPGLSLFVITTCVEAQAIPESLRRDDRIGVCTHFGQNWPVEQIMPLIAKSGAGWIRDDFGWAAMEPTPGKYHVPAKAKAWIQAARAAGLKVDIILAYGNPAYADRYDTAAYAKAAGWLARELANDVQAIEILNEPNNFGFRDLYRGQWNGNEPNGSVSPYLQKYVQILNAAAKEIKLANPHMEVIGLGAPPPASFRMIALGLAPQVNGLTDHPYSGRLPELILYPASPDILHRDGIATADANGTLASQVSMFRAQAKKWGATEKLWHTEWGYSTVRAKPGKPPGMSEETQAVYILRRLLESEVAGVEHTFIYDFKDDGVDPYSNEQNFGLIHNNLSAKPAYLTLQRLTGLIAGMGTAPPAKQASIENDPAVKQEGLGYRCHTFSSSDEPTTLVAFWEVKPWDPNASTTHAMITLPLTQEPRHVFLYDLLTGRQTEISGKWSEHLSNEAPAMSPSKDSAQANPDRRIEIPVSLSAVPQLLIVR